MDKIGETLAHNWGVKQQISAKMARITSNQPIRALNVIFRNIKEEAELGSSTYVHSAIMSAEAESFIIVVLKDSGFTVEAIENMDKVVVAPEDEYNAEKSYQVREVTLVISW